MRGRFRPRRIAKATRLLEGLTGSFTITKLRSYGFYRLQLRFLFLAATISIPYSYDFYSLQLKRLAIREPDAMH